VANPTMIKNYAASAVIPPNVIVKFDGVTDGAIAVASSSADGLVGVSTSVFGGQNADVIESGIANLKLGIGGCTSANVAAGKWLTSDANGAGVVAFPGVGVNVSVVGKPLASGNAGDIIPILVSPDVIQG
jgi:hypothetical protein